MDFPDELLLGRIRQRNLYCDRQSREKLTDTVKPKLKLASRPVLDEYFFHVLTSQKGSCKARCTLFVRREEWTEVADVYYLGKPLSCCDITKFELIGKTELLYKMKDRKNGFPYVARMSPAKYGQLKKLAKKAVRMRDLGREDVAVVKEALADHIDEIKDKLRL